jgi:hypothetical protein
MPIAVKWLNVLPSERAALRLMPASRDTLFVAAAEQREAAFGCKAVVNAADAVCLTYRND